MVGTDAGLGYGWAFAYGMRLVAIDGPDLTTAPWVDVVQENGSRVRYASDGAGRFVAPLRVMATLDRNEDGSYRFVRGAQQVFLFDAAGRLVRTEDLNGQGVSLMYDTSDHLVQVTEDAGRSLAVTWSGSRIAQVSDPAGRTVSYTYSAGGDLLDVAQVDGTHLGYGYSGHRVTTMTGPGGAVTKNVYDSAGRVTSQTDPLGRVTTFAYTSGQTTITSPGGSVTVEWYTDGRLTQVTTAYGTSAAATTTFQYGPTNQVVSSTDPVGRTTTATYDGEGNRRSMTDPAGATTTWTYNALGNMTKATSPTGAVWSATYDARGNLTGMHDPTGATTTVALNPDGAVASVTDPMGEVWSYGYDAVGNPVSLVDPTGAVTTTAYDVVGQLVSATSADGAVSTYAHDAAGRVTAMTDPMGATTTMTYNAAGLPVTVTDPLGRVTTSAYDAVGQITSATDPAGAVTTFVWDADGQVSAVTDPTGATTTWAYDAVGRVVGMSDPLGRVTTVVYDKAGQATSLSTPSGATTSYAYDLAGRLTKTTAPDGSITTTTYDAAGRPVKVSDALGRQVTATYDAADRVTGLTRADGSHVTWALDAAGRTTSMTDPSGTTAYAYDAVGQVVSVTDAAGRVTAYGYDAAGDLTSRTAPDGSVTGYGYDLAGRLVSTTYPDSTPDVAYVYDVAGQVVSVSDGTSYTWTPTGLVGSVTSAAGPVSYARDAAGRVTTLGYPGGRAVEYAFDAAGQLVGATDWAGGQYGWAWTDDAQVASVTYPNAVTTAYDHDSAGQTTAVTTTDPVGADLLVLGYGFDAAGQLVDQVVTRTPTGRSPPAAQTTTASGYAYDPLGRLDQATGTGAGPFGWDTAGRLTGTPDGRTLSYDSAGQVTEVADPTAGTTTALAYDARGNRTSATATGPGGTTSTTMAWDAADRMTALVTPAGTTSYTYSASGLRTSATTTTTAGTTSTEQYTWDTAAPVPTLLADATHAYVYGPDDIPVAQGDLAGTTMVYLHTDLVGSVRTVTSADGAVVCDGDYDPYGRTTSTGCAQVTRFAYAGQYTDPSGLVYMRARYYDPGTGQFLSVDPLVATTFDPYGYAGANPLQNTDPLGLDWQDTFWDGVRVAADTTAGFGDTITFGTTKTIRRALDIDAVNYCSAAYTAGTYTAIAVSFALPVPGLGAFTGAARTLQGIKTIRTITTVTTRISTTTTRGTTTARAAASATAQRWRTIAPQLRTDTGAIGPQTGRIKAGELVVYNSATASRTLLGQVGEGYAVTPAGRTVSAHAAERIVYGAPGRSPTTLSRIDDILDNPTGVLFRASNNAVRVSQGRNWVVVSGSRPHIVTVMVP